MSATAYQAQRDDSSSWAILGPRPRLTRSHRARRGRWAPPFGGLLLLAAIAALSGAACSQPKAEGPKSAGDAPAAKAGLLPVGAPAPDVSGEDGSGKTVSLHERQGHVSIVYFYPKDGTPGCTKEACAFRDAFDKFAQHDVTIFGVSRDDAASHAKFRAEHSLQFPLVADPEGKAQLAYGVPDRMPGLASRVTFLIAADGRIAKVWPDVDPAVHADEVWAAIDQLK